MLSGVTKNSRSELEMSAGIFIDEGFSAPKDPHKVRVTPELYLVGVGDIDLRASNESQRTKTEPLVFTHLRQRLSVLSANHLQDA